MNIDALIRYRCLVLLSLIREAGIGYVEHELTDLAHMGEARAAVKGAVLS